MLAASGTKVDLAGNAAVNGKMSANKDFSGGLLQGVADWFKSKPTRPKAKEGTQGTIPESAEDSYDHGGDTGKIAARFGIKGLENPLRRLFGKSRDVTEADSHTVGAGYGKYSASLTRSKDNDWFVAWSISKEVPHSQERARLGFSVTADYIDGGPYLTASERADIIGGPQAGFILCKVGCWGRSYSPTTSGAVGTTVIGVGAGYTFGVGSATHLNKPGE
jgi:hypothetical protein